MSRVNSPYVWGQIPIEIYPLIPGIPCSKGIPSLRFKLLNNNFAHHFDRINGKQEYVASTKPCPLKHKAHFSITIGPYRGQE